VSNALTGLAVVVTGASSGIGRSIALACANAGADVALTFRANENGARATRDEIRALGREAHSFQLDLANAEAIRAFRDSAVNTLGRLNVWVNNAGADILTGNTPALPVLEQFDQLVAVDLRGTVVASWAAAETMANQATGGVIINMSWDHVISGMKGTNPQMFAAVKGGVLAFSKALARSVAPRVRVNVLAPGWIDTAFAGGLPDERRDSVSRTIPLQRWGTPEDVAAAAVFLASPSAAYLTGQTLFVGGGSVM
jgi:3-oxoacyl-[acyl-carrier protein] reductase